MELREVKRDAKGRFSKTDITGQVKLNTQGVQMRVVKYINSNKMYVSFDKYNEIKKVSKSAFDKGLVKCEGYFLEQQKSKIGERKINSSGQEMIITKYNGCNDVDVLFPKYNEEVKGVQYTHFKEGVLKSVFAPNVYGVGFLGTREKIDSRIWKTWSGMLERCYTNKYKRYIDCEVCKEWHNYSNFAKWYKENYYTIEDEIVELDKDVLRGSKKLYSPKTCVFIPRKINTFIATNTSRKTNGLPTGVYKRGNKIISIANFGDKRIERRFDNIIEASKWYIDKKTEYYNKIVDSYLGIIPNSIYKILKEYKIKQIK
ncbi:MAG: hypothetical protein KHZ90_09675 [Veillonella parvula]|uniref:Uncharacterized protein n=1 Tax=Veillonella parvula TaxID=29466 RepID=A0A943A4E7_VEIPA|nr:hypothetical protein [Veillonella parvula]MBS4894024.1 hypothetical protein [Veillonella parvula]